MSTSPPAASSQQPAKTGAESDEEDDDPNAALPSAGKSVVNQIPKTPPKANSPYSLGDSDDDLEYTK